MPNRVRSIIKSSHKKLLVAVFYLLLSTFGCQSSPSKINRETTKPSLIGIKTYANAYHEYTRADLEKLKRFDIVVIDPYDVPDTDFVKELKQSKTIVLAYVDIGEAEEGRVYFKKLDKSLIIGPNPDWAGCWFADVNNPKWHQVILEQAISHILKQGAYDGLCLDMLDTVDDYPNLKPGMITLVKKIRKKYPNLVLAPNRGFAILNEIAPYIDAFKYEEALSRYDFDSKKYLLEEDKDEQKILFYTLKKHPMPVLVLDHLKTNPVDEKTAKICYKRAKRFSQISGCKFLWYGNSVEQDLPMWSFLPFSK